MSKRIFILIAISFIFFVKCYAYTLSEVVFQVDKKGFIIKLKKQNNMLVDKVDSYDYGVNLLIKNISFDKIHLKKFNSNTVINNVKIIPIKKNLTLLKIQTNEIFDKNKLKLENDSSYIVIAYGKNIPSTSKVKKDASTDAIPSTNPISKIDKEDKIIEELTRKPFEEKINIGIQEKANLKENSIPKQDIKKDFNFTDKIIKTYSLLAIMCIFLIGLSFFIKKLKSRKIINGNNDIFKVVYKYDISPKKSLAIIKLYSEYLLVGITEYNINLIAKIESEDIKNEIKLIEGEREKNKFIKYLKEQSKEEEKKSEKIDKEMLISSIEEKIKRYKKLIS